MGEIDDTGSSMRNTSTKRVLPPTNNVPVTVDDISARNRLNSESSQSSIKRLIFFKFYTRNFNKKIKFRKKFQKINNGKKNFKKIFNGKKIFFSKKDSSFYYRFFFFIIYQRPFYYSKTDRSRIVGINYIEKQNT